MKIRLVVTSCVYGALLLIKQQRGQAKACFTMCSFSYIVASLQLSLRIRFFAALITLTTCKTTDFNDTQLRSWLLKTFACMQQILTLNNPIVAWAA